MVKGHEREFLLTVYDTIFKFGNRPWNGVEWGCVFARGTNPQSASRRLQRMDKFCDKWGIEILKTIRGEIRAQEVDFDRRNGPRTVHITYRQFTPAAKRRVDFLLSENVPQPDPGEQDVLHEALEGATAPYEGVPGRGLWHALVGQKG